MKQNICPSSPKANIFWKDIPARACVFDRRRYFEVRDGRKRYVAYWGSQDAAQAQKALIRRAAKGCGGGQKTLPKGCKPLLRGL